MIQLIPIGNLMGSFHTWSTYNFGRKQPFKMFGYMLTTKQMKATPPAGLTFLLYFSSSSSES